MVNNVAVRREGAPPVVLAATLALAAACWAVEGTQA